MEISDAPMAVTAPTQMMTWEAAGDSASTGCSLINTHAPVATTTVLRRIVAG